MFEIYIDQSIETDPIDFLNTIQNLKISILYKSISYEFERIRENKKKRD